MLNVQVIRLKDGAAPAPQGPCLTKGDDWSGMIAMAI
jgi:hypothetical protein